MVAAGVGETPTQDPADLDEVRNLFINAWSAARMAALSVETVLGQRLESLDVELEVGSRFLLRVAVVPPVVPM